MKVFLHDDGFAIEVDDIGLRTDDVDLGRLYDADFRCLVHVFIDEISAHDRQLDRVGFLHDAEVNQAVPQRCFGRDGDVIAHLVGVGERDEEGFGFQGFIGQFEDVILFFKGKEVADYIFKIGVEAAALVVAVVFGNLGVVASPRDADEGATVDVNGVDFAAVALVDEFKSFDGVERDVQAARKAVARAAGDDGQGNVGADELGAHFVDAAVAARNSHDVESAIDGFLYQDLGVSGIFRDANLVVVQIFVEVLINLLGQVLPVEFARNWVDDEANLLLAHILICCLSFCCCILV